jgi:hypothetical protein
MAPKTDPRNAYNVILPPLANQTVLFTFLPTFLGPVVRFLDTTHFDADSEYTSDHRYIYRFPHLRQL